MTKTMQLPCHLTTDERAQRGDQHLRALDDLDTLELEKSTWKKRFDTARSHEMALREICRTGLEPRSVDVVEELQMGLMVTFRSDTGEIVATRPATDQDRQLPMALDAPVPAYDDDALPDSEDSGPLPAAPSAPSVHSIDRPAELLSLLPEEPAPKRRRGGRVTVVHCPGNAK